MKFLWIFSISSRLLFMLKTSSQELATKRKLRKSREKIMKTKLRQRAAYLLLAPLLSLVFTPKQGLAAGEIYTDQSNCSFLDCDATIINGSPLSTSNGDALPFVMQLSADVNECVRLDVLEQADDMRAVLVSPSGQVWSNDDRDPANPSELRPLITAKTDVRGWYTLQIFRYNGIDTTNKPSSVKLAFGRYPVGNINCPAFIAPQNVPFVRNKHR